VCDLHESLQALNLQELQVRALPAQQMGQVGWGRGSEALPSCAALEAQILRAGVRISVSIVDQLPVAYYAG